MPQNKSKSEIREVLLSKRSSIPPEEYAKKSRKIISRLTQTDAFRQASVIHLYISMNQRNEVNTFPLIEKLLTAGKKLVVPVMNMDNGSLKHVQIDSTDKLKENEWGVMEPESGEEYPAKKLDLIIVPMVGADENRNRMGYGKGYYDRFLSSVDCPAIGLVFEDCVLPELPVEPHDRKLSAVITENRII